MSTNDYTPTIHEATFDELIDEIGRRCACVIICASRDLPGNGTQEGVATYYRGGWAAAIGLAEYARADLRGRLIEPLRVQIAPAVDGRTDP